MRFNPLHGLPAACLCLAAALVLTACTVAPPAPPVPDAAGAADTLNVDHAAIDAATDAYLLGAGDKVSVHVYNTPNLSIKGRIGESGSLRYPLLGQVAVAGLTPSQAAARIATQLERQHILRDANVRVTVLDYQSRGVTIVGQVREPGVYYMSQDRTIAEMLAQAGWVEPKAADYVLLVRRTDTGREQHRLRLEALTSGKYRGLQARAGDRVIVPKQQVFYVLGAVNAAGSYRLRDGMTVMEAIAVAGGLTPRGSRERILLKRRNDQGKLKTYEAQLDTQLAPGDVVLVQERLF